MRRSEFLYVTPNELDSLIDSSGNFPKNIIVRYKGIDYLPDVFRRVCKEDLVFDQLAELFRKKFGENDGGDEEWWEFWT